MTRDFGCNARMLCKCFVENVALKRRPIIGKKNTLNNVVASPDHADSDVSDDFEPESDTSVRLVFTKSAPNDSSNSNRNVSEAQKRINNGEAADENFERLASNWIEFKPKHNRMCSIKELNWHNNEKLCLHNNLWGINMKVLTDFMIEESGSKIE